MARRTRTDTGTLPSSSALALEAPRIEQPGAPEGNRTAAEPTPPPGEIEAASAPIAERSFACAVCGEEAGRISLWGTREDGSLTRESFLGDMQEGVEPRQCPGA